ncbi:di-heme oxidoredictase family protein [Flavobacterium sp. I3-2]|uniref:di-heme oxidoreductase family protein n=1 Tax=Flavobacterium sp. I3-2 TaxID=2748319 RepID=UPI0015AEA817|nr:di-heme oxidoredictase family protein [Flavobacterium sp. I3-2]
MKNLVLFSLIAFCLLSCSNNDDYETIPEESLIDLSERIMAGGETTIFSTTSFAYSTPAPNLSNEYLAQHLRGDVEFESIFVTAPAEINSGLGPIFNNSSCISCHPRDGRASHPENLIARSGLLVRASLPGTNPNGGTIPVPGFGTQIQNQAIFNFVAEAQYQMLYEEFTETLADGTEVNLRKPKIQFINTYQAIPSDILTSVRIGPPVFGLGLIELIPEANLIAAQDLNDSNNDGIKGKLNYVWNSHTSQTEVGRFGWKANVSNLLIQCAGAYNDDMGITNPIFQTETGFGQSNGSDGLQDDPELPINRLEDVVLYTQTLAVPAPRNITATEVRKGAKIFETIDCSKCHTPKQQTGYSPIKALSYQTFYPYSDMLLHDMGEGLADNRPDFLANGREWKTRPLWGIGLTFVVNNHTNFLHDGRARNLTEAIMWHGGEAENAKQKFKNLKTEERNALLSFLNSL